MTMRNDLEPDEFELLIVEAIRQSAREGTLPSPGFLKRCEAAGLRGLKRRQERRQEWHQQIIGRLREVRETIGHCVMTLAAFVKTLAHAADIPVMKVASALNLPKTQGLEALNEITPTTREAVQSLGIDREVAIRALTLADGRVTPPVMYPRMVCSSECYGGTAGTNQVCRKLDEMIDNARNGGRADVESILTERRRKAEELFADSHV